MGCYHCVVFQWTWWVASDVYFLVFPVVQQLAVLPLCLWIGAWLYLCCNWQLMVHIGNLQFIMDCETYSRRCRNGG